MKSFLKKKEKTNHIPSVIIYISSVNTGEEISIAVSSIIESIKSAKIK
jgi:hypothetical protein